MTPFIELLLLACGQAAPEPADRAVSEPLAPHEAPYWVERSDLELDAVLSQACTASVTDGRPVLLVFSAEWCGDCQVLRRMDQAPEVREELDRWHRVVVDVGRFDRHEALRDAFGVSSIARVVALQPTDCEAPVPQWPRLAEETLEPSTGRRGPRTADDVVAWLQAARVLPSSAARGP